MSNDVFKSLGIRVGNAPENLLDTKQNVEINKSFDTSMDNSRIGQGPSARDMLEYSLGLTKSIGPVKEEMKENYNDPYKQLEDTHGESFHSDNDKQMEKIQSTIEEISEPQHKRKDMVDKTRKPGHSEDNKRYILEKEVDDSISVVERSVQDTNFMKAMGWLEDLAKGIDERKPESTKDDSYSTRGKELFDTKEDEEGSDEEKEDVTEKSEAVSNKIRKLKKEGKPQDQSVAIALDMERRGKLGKSVTDMGRDILDELAKGLLEDYDKEQKVIDAKRAKEGIPAPNLKKPVKKGFVKAQGPGGMIFDFGKSTGNPVADNFTAALNICPEPQQVGILAHQENEYNKALEKFVTKGERAYMQETTGQTDDGTIHPEMEKALSGSFDEQTAKAIEDGHIRIVEGFVPEANRTQKSTSPNIANSGELNTSNDGPAVINQYNQEEIVLGGEVIKATSETDMALLQSMKKSGLDQRMNSGGTVIDASAGGGRNVIIDAVSGDIIE